MSVEFVAGDLFETPDLGAIAHGCNCSGAMGKGIAKEVKTRWPNLYEEYRQRCDTGEFTLGDVFLWNGDRLAVFNLATQRTWQSNARLDAIEEAVGQMIELANREGIGPIGLPRIGAGLGGLEWNAVRECISPIAEQSRVRLVVFERYVEGQAAEPFQ